MNDRFSALRMALLILAIFAIAFVYTHLDETGDWIERTFFSETKAQIEQIMEVP